MPWVSLLPFMVSSDVGVVVPMPTRPELSILNLSVPPVEKARRSEPGLKKPVFWSIPNENDGEAAVSL